MKKAINSIQKTMESIIITEKVKRSEEEISSSLKNFKAGMLEDLSKGFDLSTKESNKPVQVYQTSIAFKEDLKEDFKDNYKEDLSEEENKVLNMFISRVSSQVNSATKPLKNEVYKIYIYIEENKQDKVNELFKNLFGVIPTERVLTYLKDKALKLDKDKAISKNEWYKEVMLLIIALKKYQGNYSSKTTTKKLNSVFKEVKKSIFTHDTTQAIDYSYIIDMVNATSYADKLVKTNYEYDYSLFKKAKKELFFMSDNEYETLVEVLEKEVISE